MEQGPSSAEMLKKITEKHLKTPMSGTVWGLSGEDLTSLSLTVPLQSVLAASASILEDLKTGVNVSLPSAVFSAQVSDGSKGIYPLCCI